MITRKKSPLFEISKQEHSKTALNCFEVKSMSMFCFEDRRRVLILRLHNSAMKSMATIFSYIQYLPSLNQYDPPKFLDTMSERHCDTRTDGVTEDLRSSMLETLEIKWIFFRMETIQ